MLVFKKDLMIKRLEREGLSDRISKEIISIMDNLDGCECEVSCWRRRVYEEPVYWVVGKDGSGEYVNENDCIYE